MANGNGKRRKVNGPKLEQPTPAFDVGFQLHSQNNLENQLGTAAINTETNMEALGNQVDAKLNQFQTNTSMIQTMLQDQLHANLKTAQANTTNLQQHLEGNLAAVMGNAIEKSAIIAPEDQFVQQVAQGITPVHPVMQTSASVRGAGMPPLPNTQIVQPSVPTTWPGEAAIAGMSCADVWKLPGTVFPTPNGRIEMGGIGLDFNTQVCGISYTQYITAAGFTNSFTRFIPLDPSCCNPNQGGGTGGGTGGGGTGGGGGTLPPPPPVCPPPTFVCPPPPPITVNVNCNDKCKDDKTQETQKKTPKKYCAYCGYNGVPYIILEGDPPKNPGDKLLQCESSPLELDFSRCCEQQQQEETTYYPPGPDIEPGQPGWRPLQGCGGLFSAPILTNNIPQGTFVKLFRQFAESAPITGATGNTLLNEAISFITPVLAGTFGITIDSLLSWVQQIGTTIECPDIQQSVVIASRTVTSLLSQYVGGVFQHADKRLEYLQSFNCSWMLPTAEQATQQYLSNQIDLDRLACIVKANGYDFNNWKPTVEANRTRWNPAETLALWRRGKITTEDANAYLRQLGYLYVNERDGLAALTEAIPPISDIISMMLRDVGDEKNVDWTTSDNIFKDKYTGKLASWGYQQGIPDDMAKFLWRAHWRLPSPTQLSEFWQRLRRNPQFNKNGDLKQRLRNLLLQDDYHPDWVDSYMAVIERPLTRIDARRAFEVGSISSTDLEQVFTELGYSDENAQTLVKFSTRQLIERYKKSSLVTSYSQGEISATELDQQLREIGLNSEVVQPVMAYAKFKLTLNKRKVCTKSYKKRFLLGEFTLSQVSSQLATQGLDPDQVTSVTQAWECEKSQRGKDVSASILCGWYERGVIDATEFYVRLKNLHYSEDDAAKLVRDCMLRVGIKLDKAAQADMQKAQRQQRQAEAAAAKLARQLQRGTQQTANTQSAAQKARDLRAKKIIAIGEAWAGKTGMSLGDSIIGVRKIVDNAVANGLSAINTVYEAAEAAAKDPNVNDFASLANEIANLLVDVG